VLRRVIVARLALCLLLRMLVARLLLIAGLRWGVAGDGGLLRVVGRRLLTRRGIQTVTAVLTIAWRRVVIASRVTSIKETARHFTHALAKLGQKLQRAFILRLLRVTVARLLRGRIVGGRRLVVLLRITTLRLRIIALLRLR